MIGWKEYELEVMRDSKDNVVIVCSIENVDPMGVHTGDSITIAPAMTLTDKEYQVMRDAAIAVIREIGVETGGSNIQFAVNPRNGDMIVIDAEKGTIDVELSAEELAKRKAAWKPRKTIYTSGVLHKYAQQVGPARAGAVTHPGGQGEGHVYADI